MATIVTRSGKGSPLTHAELDANFTNLNGSKLEESGGFLSLAGSLSLNNAQYVYTETAAGAVSRVFGMSGTNTLYVGTIEAAGAHSATYFVNGGAIQATLNSAGNFGLGTTNAVNFVDFTRSSNSNIRVVATNSNTGTGADVRLVVSNGTSEAGLIMRGTAYSGAPSNALLYVTNSNPLVFSFNGTDRGRWLPTGELLVGLTAATGDAKMQVSNGLRIDPGTVSTDVNTLDYYQEGTFTPTVVGVTTAGTATYTVQTGSYTRIGDRVFFSVQLTWTGHTGTGAMRVSGLPFTAGGVSTVSPPCAIWASDLTFTGQLAAQVLNGSTQILIRNFASAATSSDVAIDTAATMYISGHYRV
ncbi:MAG: Synechococcus phage [Pseudomonadota bacterium]|jgi:hypothetical protein